MRSEIVEVLNVVMFLCNGNSMDPGYKLNNGHFLSAATLFTVT